MKYRVIVRWKECMVSFPIETEKLAKDAVSKIEGRGLSALYVQITETEKELLTE